MDKKKLVQLSIDLLLVASWALSFLGFYMGIYLFMPFGFIGGLCGGLFLCAPGLLMVALVEIYFMQKEKVKLLNEQNRILKSIDSKLGL